jgi:predicted outer membrane protein
MNSLSNVIQLRQNYQIKILIKQSKPPIWRRVIVDSRISLDALHDIIQVSMGWLDNHRHQFTDATGMIYSDSYYELLSTNDKIIDEEKILINELLKKEKDGLNYEYDFGDGWSHKIILEKILPHKKNQLPAVCIKGKRACPPEDCGGINEYQDILQQLVSIDDQSTNKELQQWLGNDFDPQFFNMIEVNQILEEIFQGIIFNTKAGLKKELQRINSNLPMIPIFDHSNELDDFDLEYTIDELFHNVESIPDVKQLLNGIQETITIISYMDEMIDESIEAFKKIKKISTNEKVRTIATNMIEQLMSNIEEDNSV